MKLDDITDEQLDEFGVYLENVRAYEDRNVNKIRRYMSSKSDEQIDEIITNFLNWETQYEDRFYMKGILTSSNIFHMVLNYCGEHGIETDIEDDFMVKSIQWGKYEIYQYNGQGTFYRVIKDGDIIFQTT